MGETRLPRTPPGAPTRKARLLTALEGGRPEIMPVAPLYLSLYLARARHEAQARLWRERAQAAGGSLPVTWDDDLTVQREAWYEGFELFDGPPDWLFAPLVPGRASLDGCRVEVDDAGCFWVDGNGQRSQLDAPYSDRLAPLWEAADPPTSVAEVASRLAIADPHALDGSGCFDLVRSLIAEVGEEYALCWHTGAPYCAAYAHLGFRGMMLALREQPQVSLAIAERSLRNSVAWASAARNAGLEVVFVEEWACSADLISPRDYRTFAWPFERDLCRELKALGLKIVFYFCGAIEDRLAELAALEADALAFEESKKGFTIDLAAVRRQSGPDRCLFGNIDIVKVRDGSEKTIRQEVGRQIEQAGPRAFVTSIGSPLTLDTPPQQVDRLMQAARAYPGA